MVLGGVRSYRTNLVREVLICKHLHIVGLSVTDGELSPNDLKDFHLVDCSLDSLQEMKSCSRLYFVYFEVVIQTKCTPKDGTVIILKKAENGLTYFKFSLIRGIVWNSFKSC